METSLTEVPMSWGAKKGVSLFLGLTWQQSYARAAPRWIRDLSFVHPPLKTLWCQARWNGFQLGFKSGVGRMGASGINCPPLISINLLPTCRREKLLCGMVLATRRVEGRSFGAQSVCSFPVSRIGKAVLTGISKANPRLFLTLAVRYTGWDAWEACSFSAFSFQYHHQSLLMF